MKLRKYLSFLGPGIAIAATGVGAGDMIAAAVSGSRYGFAVVWAALVGAILKFVMNEGLARWQLATGTTLLEGWVQRLGPWVKYYFLIYLVLWSFIVGAALISACGLAAHAIFPGLSVESWGLLHSFAAALVVLIGGYNQFEGIMKLLIGFMFVTILGCAIWIEPPTHTLIESLRQAAIPAGSPKFILGVIGGVGGSLTLLSYGYWIREKGWNGSEFKKGMRIDLGVSYFLTGVFGVAIMILAATVLYPSGATIAGSSGVLKMADMLGNTLGPLGHWAFIIGFWGAVSTSMIGVWQGVPYLFCDFIGLVKKLPNEKHKAIVSTKSIWYRGYLIWLAIVPSVLLIFNKPVGLIIAYSIMGALFMPFLSGTLLYMNSRKEWVGEFKNGLVTTILLILCLVLFGYLFIDELLSI